MPSEIQKAPESAPENSDSDLVRRAQEGDLAAFQALFERYYDMVYQLSFRLTSRREEAEDIAQETFVKAGRYLGQFRGDSSFKTWLTRIAINASTDAFKKRKREEGKIEKAGLEPQQGDNPGEISKETLSTEVQRALNKLPEKQRQVIVLTLLEDHSHDSAAKILGCSINTVSWRVFAAKGKLKKLLKGKWPA